MGSSSGMGLPSVSSSSRPPSYAYDQSQFSTTGVDSACRALSQPVLFAASGDMFTDTCYSGAPVVFSPFSILDEPALTTCAGGIDLTLLDCLPPGAMTASLFFIFSDTFVRRVRIGPC